MTWTATLTADGTLLLPSPLLEKLRLRPGSRVRIAEREGRFELEPAQSTILDWYGSQAVDGPQDWASIRSKTRSNIAAEAVRESESD